VKSRLAAWAIAALVAAPAAAVGAGAQVQPMRAADPDSSVLSLEQFRGRVVYVDFWASWCAPCLQAMPEYEKLWQEYEPRGLTVLGVNVDSERVLALRALRRTGATFPVVLDPLGRWPAAFAAPAMPTAYVVGRTGLVRHVHAGFRPGDEAAIRAALEAALEEQP
jgi:thiol-disulfide isomerase/thioredoxin